MSRRFAPGRLLVGGLVAAIISVAAIASFTGNGVQVEAGGVEMTLKASTKTGLLLVFAAV